MLRRLTSLVGFFSILVAQTVNGQPTTQNVATTSTTPISKQAALAAQAAALILSIDKAPPPASNVPSVAPGSMTRSAGTTARSHVDIAQQLLTVSRWIKAQGDASDARDAAERALAHTASALQMTTAADKAAIASIHDLEGLIYETALGQSAPAIQAYQAARVMNPRDSLASSRLVGLGGSAAGSSN